MTEYAECIHIILLYIYSAIVCMNMYITLIAVPHAAAHSTFYSRQQRELAPNCDEITFRKPLRIAVCRV